MASKIVQQCGHCCGNTTALTIAAAGSQPSLISTQEKEMTTWTTWRVLLCATCTQPTLERDVQEAKRPIGSVRPSRSMSSEVFYPIERSTRLLHIPSSIQEIYREALKVEKISPRACAACHRVDLRVHAIVPVLGPIAPYQ